MITKGLSHSFTHVASSKKFVNKGKHFVVSSVFVYSKCTKQGKEGYFPLISSLNHCITMAEFISTKVLLHTVLFNANWSGVKLMKSAIDVLCSLCWMKKREQKHDSLGRFSYFNVPG